MAIELVLKSSEIKLMELLGSIDNSHGWYAVDFHLCDLLEQYKSEYQIKIAVNLVNDLLKNFEGGIFLLKDQSIVVLCNELDRTLLNKLIFQLRYLYMDDPLAYLEDGQENPAFSTVYDLARDWQAFWDLSSRRMAVSVRKPVTPAPPRPLGIQPPAKPVLSERAAMAATMADVPPKQEAPISVSRLASVEDEIRHVDLSKVIRRQPVCAVIPGSPARRVFDELYINIAHLRKTINASADFFSNRWLFKYLTQVMDERMIKFIRVNPSQYLESPISLNLNVETLLSSWFAEFDAMIKPAVKVSVIIEVPVVDVFADINGFMAARQEAQKLGYRVCIDGLTTASFLNIDREKLGLDLVKVQWNADAASDLNTPENRALTKAVQTAGSNRVILCRCDNKQAVEFGQAMGISLFQGRYLDSLIDPHSKVQN